MGEDKIRSEKTGLVIRLMGGGGGGVRERNHSKQTIIRSLVRWQKRLDQGVNAKKI
jgi:hypothetical protein